MKPWDEDGMPGGYALGPMQAQHEPHEPQTASVNDLKRYSHVVTKVGHFDTKCGHFVAWRNSPLLREPILLQNGLWPRLGGEAVLIQDSIRRLAVCWRCMASQLSDQALEADHNDVVASMNSIILSGSLLALVGIGYRINTCVIPVSSDASLRCCGVDAVLLDLEECLVDPCRLPVG
eukprot:s979_g17.t1